jgi:hypothetical protein
MVLCDAKWVSLSETVACGSLNLQMMLCRIKFWLPLDEIKVSFYLLHKIFRRYQNVFPLLNYCRERAKDVDAP